MPNSFMRDPAYPTLLRYLPILALVVATSVSPVLAESSWHFYLRGMAADYNQQHPCTVLKDPRGVEVGVEYRMRRSFGLELAMGRTQFQARGSSGGSGYLALHPLTLTTRFHRQLSSGSGVFIGPQFGWISYSTSGVARRQDEVLIGAKAGLEFRLGDSPWMGGLEVRRFKADPLFRYPDLQIHRTINVTFVSLVLSYTAKKGGGAPARAQDEAERPDA